MTHAALRKSPPQIDARSLVIEEMAAAVGRLQSAMPEADAAQILRLSIGYFAELHARSFGHAETVKALIAITRRGLWSANEELTATRN